MIGMALVKSPKAAVDSVQSLTRVYTRRSKNVQEAKDEMSFDGGVT